MKQQLKAEDFTSGFNYSIKSGEMNLNFFCDCCGNEVKVSTQYNSEIDDQQQIFDKLKNDMHGKFVRCSQCNLLVCQECWDNRNTKCTDCKICVEIE